MCASVYSSLFLYILIIFTIISINRKMSAEGLPYDRQERGIDDNHNNDDYDDDGILAGEDFLSILMRSTIKRNYHHPLSTITESTTDVEYNRETRSLPQQTEANTSLYETTISDNNNNNDNNNNKNNSHNDKQSSDNSSVDRTSMQEDIVSTTQSQEEIVTTATSADDLPSLIAESNKHSFGVEETEPITLRSDLLPIQFDNNNDNDDSNGGGYPARVQPLPPNQFHHQSTSSFITQQFENDKDKIHHTLIFHDGPNSTGRARSVSYSTVIQALPTFNQHQSSEATKQDNKTNYPALATTTSTPTTTTTTTTTTERNWEQSPVVYNVPEQNYEIDESVSVMTNGRIHGVQTTAPPTTLPIIPTQQQQQQSNKNVSNNNKIGYVVQGRNYRKYRVEERTSDGFIVGEYGVVSNDDGTLRGVRYTADGTISRRLIQDALMKFLSL